jgi:ABC-type uncharacterized transport system permease subunit
MHTTNHSLVALVPVIFYLVSGLFVGLRLFRASGSWMPPRWLALSTGFVALAVHATLLYRTIVVGSDLNLGFFNAVSLVAWTIALLLMLSALTKPVENLGIVLFPFAALAIILEIRYPSVKLLGGAAAWELRVHVLISILAYSLLTLASFQALLLAIQDHHLRHRHPGGFVRALPPLQTMETLLFEMIGVGFFLLSLSLVSGFMFLEDMFHQRLVHKTVLSIIAWVVFGVLLWGRYRFGWRGRTAIIWTVAGFAVLMLAYFGSKAVIELILTA